jgi:cytochrome b6-f complex iron-sulfur subunit
MTTTSDAGRRCGCGPLLTRRTVLAATGAAGAAGALAACGGGAPPVAEATSAPGDPVITDLETLRAEGAVSFETDDGQAIAVALDDGVVAYSAVCTHEGCTVSFDGGEQQLICPCHGSRFDPADGGAVINGPARRPLPEVAVEVDETEGVLRRA